MNSNLKTHIKKILINVFDDFVSVQLVKHTGGIRIRSLTLGNQ